MLDSLTLQSLNHLVDKAASSSTLQQLESLAGPDTGPDDVAVVAKDCSFDHAAGLVFTDDISEVAAFLRSRGCDVSGPVASVVVRERLARRYGLRERDLDVSILHGTFLLASGVRRGVEVFCVPRNQASEGMITREERERHESHVAFNIGDPGPATLDNLRTALVDRLGVRPDGGGYNRFELAAAGGRSVLYFAAVNGTRLELSCAGHFPEIIDGHRRISGDEPHHALLSALTGHWAARAIYVAARLGLADVLAAGPLTAEEVATRLGCDHGAIARLLRYLSSLDIVLACDGSRYAIGSVGALLSSDNPFRDLVLLYGEDFYHAWDSLLPAIQQGRSAFGLAFGEEHFEYFTRKPEAARTFDRAMAAVTGLVAEQVCGAYDFSECVTVVDVGGGNGTLLTAVLRENPGVTGILLDRPHVTDGANGSPDIADRYAAVPGDFFDAVPGGHDVYLLSRVLHDWNDEDCARILRVCRTACPDDAVLLVLERLLPDGAGDPRGSLAVPWDMQMLAITGGWERTQEEFGRLLHEAGFELGDVRSLPLDVKLLVAAPARMAAGTPGQQSPTDRP